MSMYGKFDRSKLSLLPLDQRVHDMDVSGVLPLDIPVDAEFEHLDTVASRVLAAREKDAPVILMMGAHVIKAGLSRFVIDLMERGLITHIGFNGACTIHDFELALIGATTESVAKYIQTGQFGLWNEVGRINDIVKAGVSDGLGYGEALGQAIEEGELTHRDISILAAGYRLKIPVTVHIGIGYDIIHQHPNFDGGAMGQASYTDFLIFARTMESLEGGVFLNYGTAVMGPEVYLKALAMVRNVARQQGREIKHFTSALFDMAPLEGNIHQQPCKSNPMYYFRPWKTVLIRTVADGGESYYIQGDHKKTMPALHKLLNADL